MIRYHSVKDEAEAIATANDSVFGLGSGVITRDLVRGERIAAEMVDGGCVFVNDAMRSDPRLPFGGVKESGYSRELSTQWHQEARQHKDGCSCVMLTWYFR